MIKTYTIDEAAELCKASNDTIYEAVHSFDLKASKKFIEFFCNYLLFFLNIQLYKKFSKFK
jgi:hypothetical protein